MSLYNITNDWRYYLLEHVQVCFWLVYPVALLRRNSLKNWSKLRAWSVTGQAVCRRLWCTAPLWDHHQQCHTQHMPWADGTPCGVDKWCHRGECVSRRNLEPVHGQWGEWGRYGECSRTCGGGVKRKYRECDNPAPKNGGNYCIGERVKYRSCGTRECPPGSPDFRYVSCMKRMYCINP